MSAVVPCKFTLKPLILPLGFVLGLNAVGVSAQEQPSVAQEDEELFERVMVTASKRSTGLQETPIAVTVTSAEDILQTNVLDIGDLQAIVPTLRVTTQHRSTASSFSIRGFGNGANNIGVEPSAGVFIDGVYRSRAAAQIGDLPRLEQIETLSGPQSTLFGKNASAGVISVRTAAPGFENEGSVEFGIGNDNQRIFRGFYNHAVSDEFAVNIGAGWQKRDGTTDSLVGLDDMNTRDRWYVRGQAYWELENDINIRVIADHSEIDERCCTVVNAINGPTAAAVRALGGVVLDVEQQFDYKSALNFNPDNAIEDTGISVQVDVDYDRFTLTSISAFRNNNSNYFTDVDYTSLDIANEAGRTDIDTFTQEFRLTSRGHNTLDWMVGGFYFSEDIDTEDTLFYGAGTRPYLDVIGFGELLPVIEGVYGLAPGAFFAAGPQLNNQFSQENEALTLFATLDYDLTEQLTATLGLAYTEDEKDVSIESINNEALSSIDFNTDLTLLGAPLALIPDFTPLVPVLQSVQFLPPQLEFPNSVESGNTSDDDITWNIRLAYDINENFNVFASAATGFKASSWNLSRDSRPFSIDQAALEAAGLTQANQSYGTRYADPEKSTVYELGVKARFREGAFNLVFFDQAIEDFQAGIFVGTGFVFANAGKRSTKGLEFDSTYNLTDDLVFNFAGTLLDPIYDEFEGASGLNGPISLSGEAPFGVPERSYVIGLTYHFELSGGTTGFVRSDYSHESEVLLASNVPPELTREVNTINASAGFTMENGMSVKLWVRNLNNDEYFLLAFPAPLQDGSFNVYPSQPRTFGATVSYAF